MKQINLQNVHGCLEELEACSNGLTYFDHLYLQALDRIDETEATWEATEAEAAIAAREDAPKAATATEIKGRMTDWINKRPSAVKAREDMREAKRDLAKLERWIRTAEKRSTNAQSARHGHEQLMRGGG